MQIKSLTKITVPRARDICALAAAGGFTLSARDDASPAEHVSELLAGKNLTEALQFFAFALPPREAVWWACLCARDASNDALPPSLEESVAAAETWVRHPTDEHRRTAMLRAQASDLKSSAACAALAAFWSGGSIAPEDLPEVPVAPHCRGVAVAGAVMLAAVQTEPQTADLRRARYIASAIDIANGGNGRIETTRT